MAKAVVVRALTGASMWQCADVVGMHPTTLWQHVGDRSVVNALRLAWQDLRDRTGLEAVRETSKRIKSESVRESLGLARSVARAIEWIERNDMSERVPNWPKTNTTDYQRSALRITCSHCEASIELARTVVPPSRARQIAVKNGWEVAKKWKSAKCPACVANSEPNQSPANETQKRGMRMVMVALNEAYDDSSNCYEQGWSDQRIADDVEMSVEFVARIREEFFGPVEDPRIGELRSALTQERSKLQGEINELREMVRAIEKSASDRMDEIGRRLAKLSGPK